MKRLFVGQQGMLTRIIGKNWRGYWDMSYYGGVLCEKIKTTEDDAKWLISFWQDLYGNKDKASKYGVKASFKNFD